VLVFDEPKRDTIIQWDETYYSIILHHTYSYVYCIYVTRRESDWDLI
jgi:hypothetical protein